MLEYNPPIEDMRFVLDEMLRPDILAECAGDETFDADLVDAVLGEAGRVCAQELQPLNQGGDADGCQFDAGKVTTPSGFKAAYKLFSEGGWNILSADERYGGQHLPETVNFFVTEMLCSANLSFSMYPGLTHGAYNAIAAHGTQELKDRYLPHLVTGRFAGTMCLTEAHSGTDLGLLRTRAEPADDGSYTLTGTKIFISAGDHDLAENIIHLVLARVPGGPPGIKGISLFLVPKYRIDDQARIIGDNGVECGAIEHKMGIRAASTCVINFDGAQGWLLGELHRGMHAMFTMMNAARLAVGVQGIGIAEASYQGAAAYARERLQGRALKGARNPDQPADPILVHPDVRRMLLTVRAYTEGMRTMGAWVAAHLDVIERHPDKDAREAADDLVALMTPVCKSLFSDLGTECANLGMQVFGGHGYIRDNGMEQLVRDVRIAQIYEGTNGIQALDLVGRKLSAHTGRYLRRFFHPVSEYLEDHQKDEALAEFVAPVAKAFGRLQQATGKIAMSGMNDPDEAAAVASDYLRLFGLVTMGYLWLRSVDAALQLQARDSTRADLAAAKIATARFFMQKLLPQTGALFAVVMAGGGTITDFQDAAF